MQNVKPWQIALFVAAIAALAFGMYWSFFRGPKAESTNRTVLVDVTTGELFEFSTKKRGVVIPERNPDSGKIALFPATENDQGQWVVERRYYAGGALEEVEGDPAKLDQSTGVVSVTTDAPKKVSR